VSGVSRMPRWEWFTSRPFAARLQLLLATFLLYPAGEVGAAAWRVGLATVVGVALAWLGSRVLRRQTWAWFVMLMIAVINLVFGLVNLFGVSDDISRRVAFAVVVLSCLILQALVTVPPRQEVWKEVRRQRRLVFAGVLVITLMLVAGEVGDGSEEEAVASQLFIGALAIAGWVWAYLTWRAVRRFRSAEAGVNLSPPAR
jgi:drug/metabolite transporter (DMT)-like permease